MSFQKKNNNMKKYSFDEIHKLDKALYELASYEVTKGMMPIPHNFEEAVELQNKSADKFNEFKKLIQKGECTFSFIKQRVLAANGPHLQQSLTVEDEVELLTDPNYIFPDDENEVEFNIGKVINSFLDEILGPVQRNGTEIPYFGTEDQSILSEMGLSDFPIESPDPMELPEHYSRPPNKVEKKETPKTPKTPKTPTSKKIVKKKTPKKKTTDNKSKKKPQKNDDKS